MRRVAFAYNDFMFTHTEAEGELDRNTASGADGGRISGLGGGVNYDTRNGIFFSTKSRLADACSYRESALTGSQFNYRQPALTAQAYS